MGVNKLGSRDPRSLGEVTGNPRGALKSKSTWTDEDSVRGVKRDRVVRGLAETGYVLTSRRSRGGQVEMDSLSDLSLKTTSHAGFPVWASNRSASAAAE